MTAPVKSNQTNPADPYGYEDPYATDDPYADPYSGYYGDEMLGEDEFVEGEEAQSPQEYTAKQTREEVQRLELLLKDAPDLTPTQRAALENALEAVKKKINKAATKQGEALQLALQEIFADLTVIETDITGIDPATGEADPTIAMQRDIEATIEAVKANENIPEDKKEEYLGKLEQWLEALKTPGMADIEMINGELQLLKEDFNKVSLYPAEISRLADLFPDMDLGEIEKKFKAKGIDLPITELSAAVIETLAEMDPALGEKLEKIKACAQEELDAAKQAKSAQETINQANRACTSDGDNQDCSSAQKFVDIKHKQHPLSKNTKEAKEAAREALLPYLQALFGEDAGIEKVSPSTSGGAQGNYDAYMAADQLKIGGKTIDLFDNASGGLLVSSNPDPDPLEGQNVSVAYDKHDGADSSGHWTPSVNNYGMAGGATSDNYDPDADDAEDLFA